MAGEVKDSHTSGNMVTKSQVLVAASVQQVTQITLGYFWMDTHGETGGPISMHIPQMEAIAPTVLCSLEAHFRWWFVTYLWLTKRKTSFIVPAGRGSHLLDYLLIVQFLLTDSTVFLSTLRNTSCITAHTWMHHS